MLGIYQDGESICLIGKEETRNGVVQRQMANPNTLALDHFGQFEQWR